MKHTHTHTHTTHRESLDNITVVIVRFSGTPVDSKSTEPNRTTADSKHPRECTGSEEVKERKKERKKSMTYLKTFKVRKCC